MIMNPEGYNGYYLPASLIQTDYRARKYLDNTKK